MIYIILFIGSLSYLLCHLSYNSSFFFRIASIHLGLQQTGATYSNLMQVMSNILLWPFLLSISLLIEDGYSIEELLFLVFFTSLTSTLVTLFLEKKFIFVTNKNMQIIEAYTKENSVLSSFKVIFKKTNPANALNPKDFKIETPFVITKKWEIVTIISLIFMLGGFFIAYFFAMLYPEFRLTIIQSAIVFHGIGTALWFLKIEPKYAELSDLSLAHGIFILRKLLKLRSFSHLFWIIASLIFLIIY